MRTLAVAVGLLIAASLATKPAFATGGEPPDDPTADPAACFAAAATPGDADRVIKLCDQVIKAPDTGKPERVRALLARAAAHVRAGQADRAIADYDDALRLEPNQPDALNARGELWLGKGERRKALADFAAALKLQPDHASARANYRALAREIERIGVRQAVAGRPSFDCVAARRPAAKAICADPALADLDREIDAVYRRVLRDNAGQAAALRRLRRERAAFLAGRDAAFGRPGYDLAAAMRARLRQLTGADGY